MSFTMCYHVTNIPSYCMNQWRLTINMIKRTPPFKEVALISFVKKHTRKHILSEWHVSFAWANESTHFALTTSSCGFDTTTLPIYPWDYPPGSAKMCTIYICSIKIRCWKAVCCWCMEVFMRYYSLTRGLWNHTLCRWHFIVRFSCRNTSFCVHWKTREWCH